jgi:hypothetical protein
MYSIKEYKLVGDFKIWLKFDDGFESIVNLKPLLGKGIASELLSPNAFRKVSIESGGGLVWDNGFDICPNYLREMAGEKLTIS